MERCQEVAVSAERLGAEGVRWASATGLGHSLAVFVEKLRPGSHAEIVRTFDFTAKCWRHLSAVIPSQP